MAKEYIEQHDRGSWITGTRVSLDSVVYAFLRGSSPESIAQSFPVLKLEEVYGAITYYLAHQGEVDATLRQNDREFEMLRSQIQQSNRGLHNKLQEAKRRMRLQ